MMKFTLNIADIVAIISAFFGTGGIGVLLLKSKGLVHFGKSIERRNLSFYTGHETMHKDMLALGDEIKQLRQCMNNINIKMEKHISYHAGKED